MARSRSVLHFLISAAIGIGAHAQIQGQDQPPTPPPAPPTPGQPGQPAQPGDVREPRRDGPDRFKPDGERRDRKGPWERGGPKREELTPDQLKERAHRELEKLTPEQRNEVWRAVWAVLNLPAERRQQLIGSDENRRKRVREEVEQAVKNSGVQISDEQRRKFFHRFAAGRREIEEKLKKESDERRLVLMKELEAQLKEEFSKNPDAAQPAPQPPAPSAPVPPVPPSGN